MTDGLRNRRRAVFGAHFANKRADFCGGAARGAMPARVVRWEAALCAELTELIAAYNAATKLYLEAIDELRSSGDGSAPSEFEFVWLRARTARELANDAQEQMHTHAVNHGCSLHQLA